MKRPMPSAESRKRTLAASSSARLPLNGMRNQRMRQGGDQGEVEERDEGEGDGLAGDQLGGAERADHQLLEGADLALADDGQGGEQERDQHHQRPHHRRHVVVAAGEVGVVPGALADVEGGRRGAADRSPGGQRGAVGLHDALGVAEGDDGDVGVGAVDQHLDGGAVAAGGATTLEVGGEPRGDLQGDDGVAVVEGGDGVGGAVGAADDVEVAGGGEGVEQLAGGLGLVVVDDEGGGVADVGRHRVAEDHQLDHRRDEDDPPQPRVAGDLVELLLAPSRRRGRSVGGGRSTGSPRAGWGAPRRSSRSFQLLVEDLHRQSQPDRGEGDHQQALAPAAPRPPPP